MRFHRPLIFSPTEYALFLLVEVYTITVYIFPGQSVVHDLVWKNVPAYPELLKVQER